LIDTAQFNSRRPAGVPFTHAMRDFFFDQQLQTGTQFLIEFYFHATSADEIPQQAQEWQHE
jgi:hypothetical protein